MKDKGKVTRLDRLRAMREAQYAHAPHVRAPQPKKAKAKAKVVKLKAKR
jgi:hypothetical protein